MPNTGGALASKAPAAIKMPQGPRRARPGQPCAQALERLRGRQVARHARATSRPPRAAATPSSAVEQRGAAPLQGGARRQSSRRPGRRPAVAAPAPPAPCPARCRPALPASPAAATRPAPAPGAGAAWPQHAQQRKLLRALRHAERQHRKHQKRPGEQRHQRQHRQVDAVGARQVAHPLRRIAGLGQRLSRASRAGLAAPAMKAAAVGAGLQLQVDAGEAAHRPNRSCAAPMSITASGAPGAPRCRHAHGQRARPVCSCSEGRATARHSPRPAPARPPG
jgi:hypothetical protein